MRVDGRRLKARREELLLERRELAALAGVSYTTVYKMEAHGHLPRLSNARKVAKALKVKPRSFLAEDPEPVELAS